MTENPRTPFRVIATCCDFANAERAYAEHGEEYKETDGLCCKAYRAELLSSENAGYVGEDYEIDDIGRNRQNYAVYYIPLYVAHRICLVFVAPTLCPGAFVLLQIASKDNEKSPIGKGLDFLILSGMLRCYACRRAFTFSVARRSNSAGQQSVMRT